MRVYVDTNVLIDFVCQRDVFAEPANKLMALGCMGKIKLQTSALSYVTTMYVAHKYGYQNVKESLMALTQFLDVQDLQAKTVVEMLSSDWKDYEDATQNQMALLSNADCIVTRNKKDFSLSSLPIYTANELFALFE